MAMECARRPSSAVASPDLMFTPAASVRRGAEDPCTHPADIRVWRLESRSALAVLPLLLGKFPASLHVAIASSEHFDPKCQQFAHSSTKDETAKLACAHHQPTAPDTTQLTLQSTNRPNLAFARRLRGAASKLRDRGGTGAERGMAQGNGLDIALRFWPLTVFGAVCWLYNLDADPAETIRMFLVVVGSMFLFLLLLLLLAQLQRL